MILKNTLSIAVALATLSTAAFANHITVAGTDTGTFSGSGSNVYGGLTYAAIPFSNSTVGGSASLQLGTLTLTNLAFTYGGTFTVVLDFTLPLGTVPDPQGFSATVSGQVLADGTGGVFLQFGPALAFTFTNANATGSFNLFINNISVDPLNGPQTLTAQITGGQQTPRGVPDGGATVTLLGLAMFGLAAARQKLGLA